MPPTCTRGYESPTRFLKQSRRHQAAGLCRRVGGFAVSFSPTISYTSEFCHSKIRDRVMLFQSSFIAMAQVIIAVMSWQLLIQDWTITLFDGYLEFNNWNIYLSICSLWSLGATILYALLPESPKYLLSQRKYDEARAVLVRMYVENTRKPADTYPCGSLWQKQAEDVLHEADEHPEQTGLRHQIVTGLHNIKPMFQKPLLATLALLCSTLFLSMAMYNIIRLWFPQLSTIIEHSGMDSNSTGQDLCVLLDNYTQGLKDQALTNPAGANHVCTGEALKLREQKKTAKKTKIIVNINRLTSNMAMASSRVMSVEKFDGTNFRQWKFQVKCALKANGIDISIPKPATNESDWLKKDGMAMYILTSSMDLKQITLIENCETAQEIMMKLESIYEQKSELNKMLIHERFYQYKMSVSDSVAEHISKVENLAQQLKDSGESVSDLAIITKILGTLPTKYRSLRQAWMSLDPKQQTLINLTARLLDEEASITCEEEQETALLVANTKQKNQKEASASTSTQNKTTKHRFECYNCGKRGHFSRECRAPRRGTKKPTSDNTMLAFNVETNLSEVEENTWILDSGASAHMTFRKDFFEELVQCNQKSLTLGNKQSVEVRGIGKVMIKRLVNGQWEHSMLQGVLYVPSLRRNLFSEGVIVRRGYTIIKKHPNALIYKEKEVVMSAKITENNLYKLQIETVIPDSCNIVQSAHSDIKKWHERLGHINLKQLLNMSAQNVIEGLNIDNSESDFVCEACAYGKQSRLPFQKSIRGELQPGDLVYSDVCGPMSHTSVQGLRYFVLFKDAATSYRHVYFMKNKSDVLEYFKKYNAIIKNKFAHCVKILHTDNGGEYVNKAYKEYVEKEGIFHEFTAPYTPEQNGRAERELRTIVESARSMLYARNVPLNLWAEAVNCAVYILNRTSSSQTPNKTPYELWNGVKPLLGHVKVFGSIGYVHVPDQLRTKLDKKSEKMILVGYDNTNYRMYNISTKQIKVSRNVIFDENEVLQMKKNMAQICISDEENINDGNSQELAEISVEDSTLVDSSSIENEDSMLSCNSDDVTYEPSQEIEDTEPCHVNLRPRRNRQLEANVVELSLPQTYQEAMESPQKEEWSEAIKEELMALEENETWSKVENSGQRTLTTKWVFAIKKDENGQVSRYKARLCARGFSQIKGVDYEEIFSPTTRPDICFAVNVLSRYVNNPSQQHKPSGTETYINSIILGSVCVIPYLISGILVNKVGKKNMMFCSAVIAIGVTLGLRYSNTKPLVVALFSIDTAILQIMLSLSQAFVIEFFPTTMRTLAIAILMMVGRIGTLLGNVAFPILLNMGCVIPFFSMAGVLCVVTVVVVFLPSKKT
ncbi:unnamed protein product [Plutella xylostella]|uniref:(diamondback moth) hypothetical protein n=1 Tax=Plutella xylostella TaxID=51655 RepID=A0A8S4G5X7_PLUXY|nr:unnamed protein product [Plutella xylostella]